MTDRDHFAAAALTGLLSSREWPIDSDEAAHYCYRVADAMLRERGNHIPDAGKMVETPGEWRAPNGCHPTAVLHELLRTKEAIKDIADDVCGVGSGVTVNSPLAFDWLDAIAAEYHRVRIELGQLREKTIHDAAPAARASLPTADHAVCLGRGSGCGTGDTYSASACDGADVLSTHDSGGPINRAANWGQPPAHSGESERRDVPHPETKGQAAGGPAHNTTEPVAWAVMLAHAEIDRLRSLTRFQDGVIRSGDTACLTQAERDDLACAASRLESDPNGPRDLQAAATLRGLLERMGGGE